MQRAYRAVLFWFRRDLRVEDNAGLYYALISADRVHCTFVFDREILDALQNQGGAWKRKDDMYRMAQANKAFAHYRW